MGHRTLKRVPLDFAAPIDEVWEGYRNPHPGPSDCIHCGGTGYNDATLKLEEEFYDFEHTGRRWCNDITQDEVQALVDAGRLHDLTHTYIRDKGWQRREDGYVPTAAEVNLWNQTGMGHDAINRGILIEARAKGKGVYGLCSTCEGHGHVHHPDKAVRKLYEEWTPQEPPAGEGYQFWETTSEGSPQSPVFATAEELADWCAKNATVFADITASRENWLEMFVGKKSVDTGSMLIGTPTYFGAEVNKPKEAPTRIQQILDDDVLDDDEETPT